MCAWVFGIVSRVIAGILINLVSYLYSARSTWSSPLPMLIFWIALVGGLYELTLILQDGAVLWAERFLGGAVALGMYLTCKNFGRWYAHGRFGKSAVGSKRKLRHGLASGSLPEQAGWNAFHKEHLP